MSADAVIADPNGLGHRDSNSVAEYFAKIRS
jgi:hypothetical protein